MNFNLENYWLSALKCARALIEKNMQPFLRFMAKNDVEVLNQSKPLTSFLAMKHKKSCIFFSIKARAHLSADNQ